MKKIIFILALLGSNSLLFAQLISLKEDKIVMGNESMNGLIFNVCEDAEFVKDDIKKFLNENFDLKVKKKNRYTSIVQEAEIPNVSTKRGDLLIYIQHTDTGNIMGLSFLLGYDISLNSKDNKDEMGHFRDLAKDFIEYHYNSYYSNKIETLDKQLNAAKKDLHKKESNISSMKKKEMNMDKKLSKEDDQAKQRNLEEDIQKLLREIDETYDLLPALKEQIESLQSERDEHKKELLNYQNQIKYL